MDLTTCWIGNITRPSYVDKISSYRVNHCSTFLFLLKFCQITITDISYGQQKGGKLFYQDVLHIAETIIPIPHVLVLTYLIDSSA